MKNMKAKEKEASKPFILGAIDKIYSKELAAYCELNSYLP
jgi:hypothetical protein